MQLTSTSSICGADKYEDQFYFWEMVVVLRKCLLVSVFLLFNSVSAVLLATAVTMVSIGIHIAARPFEDTGTDWTEVLSLAAQLFLLVAGPVFKVLVRTNSQSTTPRCHSVSIDELHTITTFTIHCVRMVGRPE